MNIEVRDNLILIGSNGSGKSSLIRCLDLLLGKTTQQLYYNITPSDFASDTNPLIIQATLEELSDDERSHFPDEIDANTGKLTITLEASLENEEITLRNTPNTHDTHISDFQATESNRMECSRCKFLSNAIELRPQNNH